MDQQRFDAIARSLGAVRSRRAALGIAGAFVLGLARPTAARAQSVSCALVDQGCTLTIPCCAGLVCATLLWNPNSGVCIDPEPAPLVPPVPGVPPVPQV